MYGEYIVKKMFKHGTRTYRINERITVNKDTPVDLVNRIPERLKFRFIVGVPVPYEQRKKEMAEAAQKPQEQAPEVKQEAMVEPEKKKDKKKK